MEEKSNNNQKEDERDRPGEIRTIIGGLVAWGQIGL